MICKTFSLEYGETAMGVIAVKLTPENDKERLLSAREGFGSTEEMQSRFVIMTLLSTVCGNESHYNPYNWRHRGVEFVLAHDHIRRNFDLIPTGSIINVDMLREIKKEKSENEKETENIPATVLL